VIFAPFKTAVPYGVGFTPSDVSAANVEASKLTVVPEPVRAGIAVTVSADVPELAVAAAGFDELEPHAATDNPTAPASTMPPKAFVYLVIDQAFLCAPNLHIFGTTLTSG
jgi:hypothetical protein